MKPWVSVQESLRTSWILDVDTSVKLLYGQQAGAGIGYNQSGTGKSCLHLLIDSIQWVALVCQTGTPGGILVAPCCSAALPV